MNDYEARKQARIDRLRERAEKASDQANATYGEATKMADVIPFGQPILVGHHSEKRDRAYRGKIDRKFRKSFELNEKAKRLEERANAAESNTAISSDDPEALVKLREKLAELEQRQAAYKSDNAATRKAKIETSDPEAVVKLVQIGVSEAHAKELRSIARVVPYQMGKFIRWPGYTLSNNNANIKRVKDRIAELERQKNAVAAAPIEGNGFTVTEDVEDNRILFVFDQRPPKETCQLMRRHGFKWSPTRKAWVRQLNNAGRYNAKTVAKLLNEQQ